jgi:uncharacterized protein YndB with AHSA1/START domain
MADRIEKSILIRSNRSRVWRAITDSKEFGTWFGMRFEAPFRAGTTMKVVLTPTAVDDEVAKKQKAHEGTAFEIVVDRIEPETLFSFRWHPAAVDKTVDYSEEPMTLVTFTLADKDGGILVTVVESGFDRLPAERRAKAFAGNESGWAIVVTLLEKWLAKNS